jgi:hypothetical protein
MEAVCRGLIHHHVDDFAMPPEALALGYRICM